MNAASIAGRLVALGRFLEIQNLGLNLPFALAFLWVATSGSPSLRTTALVLLAFVAARNAGHSFNRWADRELDARNPRTRGRLLPTRPDLAPLALLFAVANVAVLTVAAYLLSPLAFVLVPVAAALLLGYSYTKRLTSLTTLFLGVVEALTPAGVYAGATGTLPPAALIASGAMLCWGTAFETIHSLGDLESDRTLGLRSVPVSLGTAGSLRVLYATHGLALAGFVAFGLSTGRGIPYWFAVAAMAVGAGLIDRRVTLRPGSSLTPFRSHFPLAILFLAGCLAG